MGRLTPKVARLGGFDPVANEKYKRVNWVYEGQRVIAPCVLEDGKLTGARCRVAVAAGYHARVVNEKLGADGWLHIDLLRVEVEQESVEQVRT